ncbi:WD40-repeat-containing domain protein [Zychaea mexicana]|uniref:WD40-repeat-containing domain protein n=1 Tax=Zychaea mexicana TaxID=64656 RepID=UPI0022FE1613|nr:WD40-repeat-containing domain protein [Zychaea mexicana]KAI9490380.1 WD40-repeat-containing domain protein [Zychaea mexicana]
MDVDQEQIQVRLVSRQEKHAIPDAAIRVPTAFKRFGLSEIVNNLLSHEKPIPFDFFLDGQILRTSLADYLSEKRLSTENTLTIEYVESMLPPTQLSAFQHDDWISSVKAHNGLFLTGSYDNMLRLWNKSGECVATFTGHSDAVKSVAFGPSTDSEAIILSGSLDHTLMAWAYNADNGTQRDLYECKGHKAPIESISVNADKELMASGSADSTIKIWSTAEPEEDEEETAAAGKSKRRKTEKKSDRKTKASMCTLEGHVGAVNAVVFDDSDSSVVYSGGWDHSIRSWNIEQQVNLVTKNCEKVVLDVDYSSRSRLIATGHADNVLRLWDPRSEEGTNVKQSLRGHSAWISSVSWSKTSEHLLCSGSYDSTVRVWDIRSKGPLYTVNAADASSNSKVLSVDWDEQFIISGGEDKHLRIYQTKA